MRLPGAGDDDVDSGPPHRGAGMPRGAREGGGHLRGADLGGRVRGNWCRGTRADHGAVLRAAGGEDATRGGGRETGRELDGAEQAGSVDRGWSGRGGDGLPLHASGEHAEREQGAIADGKTKEGARGSNRDSDGAAGEAGMRIDAEKIVV